MLTFPEPGIDDTAAYQGYQTRFYRDSKGNTVQIYVEPRGARVINSNRPFEEVVAEAAEVVWEAQSERRRW